MANPENNPDCKRCHGEGFYLAKEGSGYYRDGSFGHNVWEDCNCSFIDQSKEAVEAVIDTDGRLIQARHHPAAT